jgi:hypothetical protein
VGDKAPRILMPYFMTVSFTWYELYSELELVFAYNPGSFNEGVQGDPTELSVMRANSLQLPSQSFCIRCFTDLVSSLGLRIDLHQNFESRG